MDLIYTNKNNIELGILDAYDLDLAFGSDENNFSLTMAINDNKLVAGSHIYYESTEYGGIVDAVAVDTENATVTYSGRTWHGILAGKVITPPKNADYMVLSGDANKILGKLITACDLDGLFYVASKNSGIRISNQEFRYSNLYESIVAMLALVGARLKMYRIGRYVRLEAVPLTNYANNEKWDATERAFKAETVTTRVNHLICLGSGSGAQRHVIHLYADEYGVVQPYATVSTQNIIEDSNYIFDTRYKKLTGTDEIIEVYDNAGAKDTNNYIRLTTRPNDFGKNYEKYYYLSVNSDGEEKYETPKAETVEEFVFLTKQPKNWATEYANYYDVNGEAVTGIVTAEYYELLQKAATPTVKDWKKNFASYYYLKTDGVATPTWTAVQGVDVQEYVAHEYQPSDWNTNWSNYYFVGVILEQVPKVEYKDKDGKIKEKVPSFKKNYFYERTDNNVYVLLETKPKKWAQEYTQYYYPVSSGYVPVGDFYKSRPKWERAKFATLTTVKTVAPEWDGDIQYGRKHPETTTAPVWKANTYKTKRSIVKKPDFNDGRIYFELKVDHYNDLVTNGLKKLEEYKNADSIEMDLPASGYEYYIGDIVGASIEAQGFSVQPQAITKKIIKANKDGLTISYKIGV